MVAIEMCHWVFPAYHKNEFTMQVIDSLKKYLLLREIGYSEKLFESNTSIAGLRQPIVSGKII